MRIRNRDVWNRLVMMALAAPWSFGCGTTYHTVDRPAGEVLPRGENVRLCGGPKACQALCDELLRRRQGTEANDFMGDFTLDALCSDSSQRLEGCVPRDTTVELTCSTPPAVDQDDFRCSDGFGRRPVGLAGIRGGRGGDALGCWFAAGAALEAASVDAFEHLAKELVHHRAPRRLVRWAHRAARQERMHARLMAALAAERSATAARPVVAPMALRELVAIAVDNAVHGQVGESLAAFEIHVAALRAEDETTRAVMTLLARDEKQHAELAAAVDRWVMRRLDVHERNTVIGARAAAVDKACASAPPDARLASLGLPSSAERERFLRGLATTW